MDQKYHPLHQKYRPTSFDELVGQEAIKATLKQAILTNKIAPAYLFSGPRGTGKTSSARILATSLNCLKDDKASIQPCLQCELCKTITNGTALDVIEIDAASNTGVENIREIIERARFSPVQARWKVYVIDECHMLSTAAFNALLKTLEEPPEKVVFILATTDPQRVLSTIISRCQRFDFRQISLEALIKHLQMIASKEEINIEKNAIELIAKRSQGGLRDAESMLDQLSLLPAPIKEDAIADLLGIVPEKELLNLSLALVDGNPVNLLNANKKLIEKGRDPISILQGLTSVLRDLVLIKAAPNQPEICNLSKELIQELLEISTKIDLNQLIQWQKYLKGTEFQLRNSIQTNLWLEVLLIGLLGVNDYNVSNSKYDQSKNIPIAPKSVSKQDNNILEKQIINKEEPSNIRNLKDNVNTESRDKNLEEIWQEILARIELPSTRMLLSQQANLLHLNNKEAVVNVSKNWIGMVQSRKSLLEEAINQALKGDPKTVVLETKDEINIEPKETLSPKIERNIKNNNSEEIKSSNLDQEKKIDLNINSPQNEAKINSIDNKAKKLADFFNGELLDIEE